MIARSRSPACCGIREDAFHATDLQSVTGFLKDHFMVSHKLREDIEILTLCGGEQL